jgi:diamine N-acetyltransferase
VVTGGERLTAPGGASVELVPLGPETREVCTDLRVREAQWQFVAPVPHYLALCERPGSPWEPLAVVAFDRVVGFVMKGVDPTDESFWIGGLMIAAEEQGQGYGRAAVEALVAQATAARHRSVALSYQPGNTSARALYLSAGFVETGETEDDEVVARRALR